MCCRASFARLRCVFVHTRVMKSAMSRHAALTMKYAYAARIQAALFTSQSQLCFAHKMSKVIDLRASISLKITSSTPARTENVPTHVEYAKNDGADSLNIEVYQTKY